MFWDIAVIVKLLLYVVLCVFLYRTRMSIDKVDPQGIMDNFNVCKYIIYAMLAYSYLMFLNKYIHHHLKISHHRGFYSGISYVNMALISILFVFTRQADSVISASTSMPISVEVIDARFRQVESLGYLLSVFNIASTVFVKGANHMYAKRLI